MICSFCDTKMQASEREGIEINDCPKCGGIWLLRGALEGILARASGAASNDRSRADNQQSEDDDESFPMLGGRREQRGGIREFLGNLFDFG